MSRISKVMPVDLTMCAIHEEMRRQLALQGFPAKDTTLLMHEWLGLRQVCPIPSVKHLDFISGFNSGGSSKDIGGILPRAQEGNATEAIPQEIILRFVSVVSISVHSGLLERAE